MFHYISPVLDGNDQNQGLITIAQNPEGLVAIRRFNSEIQILSERKIQLLAPVVQASISKNGRYVVLISRSSTVIPPILGELINRISYYAARSSFCLGVIPPIAILGLS